MNKAIEIFIELLNNSKPIKSLEKNIIGSAFKKSDISEFSMKELISGLSANKNSNYEKDIKEGLKKIVSSIKTGKRKKELLLEDRKEELFTKEYEMNNLINEYYHPGNLNVILESLKQEIEIKYKKKFNKKL